MGISIRFIAAKLSDIEKLIEKILNVINKKQCREGDSSYKIPLSAVKYFITQIFESKSITVRSSVRNILNFSINNFTNKNRVISYINYLRQTTFNVCRTIVQYWWSGYSWRITLTVYFTIFRLRWFKECICDFRLIFIE